MKLYEKTLESYRHQRGQLLAAGTESAILAHFDGEDQVVGPLTVEDLDENGGSWGSLPDDWSPAKPYAVCTPTETRGGFATALEALRHLIMVREDLELVEDAPAISIGTRVSVPMESACGTVAKVHDDGDLLIRFEDGDEGSYEPAEVEVDA